MFLKQVLKHGFGDQNNNVNEETKCRPDSALFKKTLGACWYQLHPDIQSRFTRMLELNKPLCFTGTIGELTCSWFGKILGYLIMPLTKGALIPFSDGKFPIDVQVYSTALSNRIFWQRSYHIHGHKPVQFNSYMREGREGGLVECVGKMLGMKLFMSVEKGNLYITCEQYFMEAFGTEIFVPKIFSIGKFSLCHRNISPYQFEVSIEIRHKLFGLLFKQSGIFNEICPEEK